MKEKANEDGERWDGEKDKGRKDEGKRWESGDRTHRFFPLI